MSEVYNLRDQPASPRLAASRPRADLGALIASRICHDLVSPIGAIGNGLELMALTGVGNSPEMDLIAQSVENANALLRFFRVAYGAAAPDQTITRAEVTATLGAVARGGKVSYDWEPPEDQPRREVRAVFLLLQCCTKAMAHGGRVVVAREGATWVVTGEAPRLQVDEALWDGLRASRPRPPESANLVQFALLPEALAELGRPLDLQLGTERIVARF